MKVDADMLKKLLETLEQRKQIERKNFDLFRTSAKVPMDMYCAGCQNMIGMMFRTNSTQSKYFIR
jgi:hypothetical protein